MRVIGVLVGIALAVTLVGCGGSKSKIEVGPKPKGTTFFGVWQSPQYGNMHLCQSEGGVVVGDFEKDERVGRLFGKPEGDILRFQWEERRALIENRPTMKKGRGYFRISIGEDGDQYLQGEWGFDDNMLGGGPWNAVKMRGAVPNRCYGSSTDATTGMESTPIPGLDKDDE